MKILPKSRYGIAVAALLAGGLLVRFAALGHQSYDHDEAATLLVLHPSLAATWHGIVGMERSPPLYYLLAWPWTRLFGTHEAALRSLSALFGVLTIPAALLCARELAGRRAALVAAALVAFNPYLVWYSQEARSYALLVCFSAWALYGFLLAARAPTRRHLGIWALAATLALCSHYFAAFLVGPEALLLVAITKPRWRGALAAGAVAAVGLALAPLALAQAANGGGEALFLRWPPGAAAFDSLVELGGSAEPHGLEGTPGIQLLRAAALAVALAVALAGLVLFARSALRRGDRRRWMTLAILATGAVAPFAIALVGPNYVDPRNLIGCVVPFLVVVAAGLASRPASRLGTTAGLGWSAAFAAVLVVVWASPQMQRPDWRAIARATEPDRGVTVFVVPHKAFFALTHYLRARRFTAARYAGGVFVKHIDVVDGGSPVAKPPGFRPGGQRLVNGSFVVDHFDSRRPVDVRPAEIDGSRVLGAPATVLVEGTPASSRPS